MAILVIGRDGKIGSRIVSYLIERNYQVIGTTRRKNKPNFYLDIRNNHHTFLDKVNVSTVIICASITSIAECETNPEETNEINVVSVIRLLNYLADKGVYIIYLSSSAVFSGERRVLCENEEVSPNTVYGSQKFEVESFIRKSSILSASVAVIRPTKVISMENKFFYKALLNLKEEKPISMFSDYMLSPISINYFQSSILKMITEKIPGIFHLSGKEDVSYYKFFKQLAGVIGARSELVLPISKLKFENQFLFDQNYPSISMKLTSLKLGISPQNINSVFKDFVNG